MNKYCVHYGVRLTQDYYVLANDVDEAVELADKIFACEEFNNMDFADSDTDIWIDNEIPEYDIEAVGDAGEMIEDIAEELGLYSDEIAQLIYDINNNEKEQWYDKLKKKPELFGKLVSFEGRI